MAIHSSDAGEDSFDSFELDPITAETIATIAILEVIRHHDPEYYQRMLTPKLICDGKGPWHCEGYIGAPCDC